MIARSVKEERSAAEASVTSTLGEQRSILAEQSEGNARDTMRRPEREPIVAERPAERATMLHKLP